jgi:hypothetical protein
MRIMCLKNINFHGVTICGPKIFRAKIFSSKKIQQKALEENQMHFHSNVTSALKFSNLRQKSIHSSLHVCILYAKKLSGTKWQNSISFQYRESFNGQNFSYINIVMFFSFSTLPRVIQIQEFFN